MYEQNIFYQNKYSSTRFSYVSLLSRPQHRPYRVNGRILRNGKLYIQFDNIFSQMLARPLKEFLCKRTTITVFFFVYLDILSLIPGNSHTDEKGTNTKNHVHIRCATYTMKTTYIHMYNLLVIVANTHARCYVLWIMNSLYMCGWKLLFLAC